MSVNTIQAQIDSLKAHQKADEKKLRKAREDALQQAWLVNKQQTRMLPQQLSAQGANGGAVQSSFVSQNNEYQRNRRGAESDYANNLADSRLKYSDKFAQLQAQLADAQEAAARAAAASRGRYYGGGGSGQGNGFKTWDKGNYGTPLQKDAWHAQKFSTAPATQNYLYQNSNGSFSLGTRAATPTWKDPNRWF